MTSLPTHWERGRVKWDTVMVAGATPSTDDDNFWLEGDDPSGTPFVAIGDMSRRERVSVTAKSLSAEGLASRGMPIGQPGTLLFAMYASVGEVAFLDIGATWNQALLGITTDSDKIDSRFLRYVLLDMRDDLLRDVRSSTQANLNAGQVGDIWFQRPPLREQRAIADYLDRETARIDTLIEEQQSFIGLLRERRDSIVDAALAHRGFQPPSSLDGSERYQVPEGWQIVPLGRALRQLTNGFVGPTRDILVDDGIRYIQGTHIKAGRIDFERRPFYVSREWHDERPRIHLQEADVLIVQTGDIGKVAVVPAGFGEASCHALQIARVRPELLSGAYLGAFLTSRLGYNSLLLRATGALHPHLEAGIREVPIVVPPREVQSAIVRESGEQTAQVDILISETERFIELSRERRAALITAAVTGQIDVGAAA